MKTLQYLAGRLGKSVSSFLDEDALLSPNQQVMEAARKCFDTGAFRQAEEALLSYREPDPVYDREKRLLSALICLSLAEQATAEDRSIYARELLNRTNLADCYCAPELQHRRLLLLGKNGMPVVQFLPSLDEELLLRAREAFASGNLTRAARLLDAAEDQDAPEWNLLRGRVYLAQTHYQEAATCFLKAEDTYPKETVFRLEHCYRELEDYKRAYEYACKQK